MTKTAVLFGQVCQELARVQMLATGHIWISVQGLETPELKQWAIWVCVTFAPAALPKIQWTTVTYIIRIGYMKFYCSSRVWYALNKKLIFLALWEIGKNWPSVVVIALLSELSSKILWSLVITPEITDSCITFRAIVSSSDLTWCGYGLVSKVFWNSDTYHSCDLRGRVQSHCNKCNKNCVLIACRHTYVERP